MSLNQRCRLAIATLSGDISQSSTRLEASSLSGLQNLTTSAFGFFGQLCKSEACCELSLAREGSLSIRTHVAVRSAKSLKCRAGLKLPGYGVRGDRGGRPVPRAAETAIQSSSPVTEPRADPKDRPNSRIRSYL